MLNPIRPTFVPPYQPPAPPPALLGGAPAAPLAPPVPIAPPPPGVNAWRPAPVAPTHSGGWDDLVEMAMILMGTPLLGLAGAGVGFAIAGPVGAARGAAIGATLPGSLFALRELVTHLAKGEAPNWRLVGAELLLPAATLAGAGIGFALGGPPGAAIGALVPGLVPPALLFGSRVVQWVRERLGKSPETPVVPPPTPAPAAQAYTWGYQPIYPPRR